MVKITKAEYQGLVKVAKLAFLLKEAAMTDHLSVIPEIIGKLDKALKKVENLV